MTPVIATAEIQLGTGKFHTTLYLASKLATRGARVLLVDTDARDSIAFALGLKHASLTDRDTRGKLFGSTLMAGALLAECASEDRPAIIYAGNEVPSLE